MGMDDLTPHQIDVMTLVEAGASTAGEIARQRGFSEATAGATLRRLERSGMARRLDGRWILTPAGRMVTISAEVATLPPAPAACAARNFFPGPRPIAERGV